MLILDHGVIKEYYRDTTLDEFIETTRVNSIKKFEEWRKNNGINHTE